MHTPPWTTDPVCGLAGSAAVAGYMVLGGATSSVYSRTRARLSLRRARFGVERLDEFPPGQSDLDLLVEFGAMHPHNLVDA